MKNFIYVLDSLTWIATWLINFTSMASLIVVLIDITVYAIMYNMVNIPAIITAAIMVTIIALIELLNYTTNTN